MKKKINKEDNIFVGSNSLKNIEADFILVNTRIRKLIVNIIKINNIPNHW